MNRTELQLKNINKKLKITWTRKKIIKKIDILPPHPPLKRQIIIKVYKKTINKYTKNNNKKQYYTLPIPCLPERVREEGKKGEKRIKRGRGERCEH